MKGFPMSDELRMWVEITFNISYLVLIWGMVVLMLRHLGRVQPQERPVANRIIWAFALLALGDTGHVGFRVVAYTLGGLAANPVLVGLGSLSTAYTLTIFYMLMLDIWRLRFHKPLGRTGWMLLGAAVIRMVIMAFPQNRWEQVSAPYEWSLLRNAFLVVQGVGVLYLILRDSISAKDRPFQWIGIMIVLSFAFYAPVILWVQWIPILGMLMIPKTCAYLGVCYFAYRAVFFSPKIIKTPGK
jgi:hypothetical protein